MLILTLRTDKPEAEIGLYSDSTKLAYITWTAHRQLAETLHSKIDGILTSHDKSLLDIEAIACYAGPGSFTGLRIGLTVGNALAYSLTIPIVAETNEDWRESSIRRLINGENENIVVPRYGADAHITDPKK